MKRPNVVCIKFHHFWAVENRVGDDFAASWQQWLGHLDFFVEVRKGRILYFLRVDRGGLSSAKSACFKGQRACHLEQEEMCSL